MKGRQNSSKKELECGERICWTKPNGPCHGDQNLGTCYVFSGCGGGGPGSEPWSRELSALTAGLEGGHALSLRTEAA